MAKKKTFENIISNLLGEPVSNLCHAFYDQYVEANVRLRSRAGMKTVIIRRQIGRCCDWCGSKAGIFTPNDAPDDIYKRHDYCRCMVTFKNENGYTDVWSKKEFKTQKDARKVREQEIAKTNNDKGKNRVWTNKILEGLSEAEKKSIIKRLNYRNEWEGYSLKDTIEKLLPPKYQKIRIEPEKIVFKASGCNYEIVYDYRLDYFRIIDNSLPGKRKSQKYVDITGRNAHNVIVNGKTRGRTRAEWEKATHFRNID